MTGLLILFENYFGITSVNNTGAGGQLEGVVRARRLSKAMMANITQNLILAFAYNLAFVPVAAGLLYAFGGPVLDPMMAAAAMSLSSVSVIANALRLRSIEL